MKIYISADIEGVTGTTHWDETDKAKSDYSEFRDQMTAEVAAACEGALKGGASEIIVKDAHDTARNIAAARLPKQARLRRGWSGHPFGMVEGLDESFGALLMVGYHARAASSANPLAHTMNGGITSVRINDRYVSEFLISAYTAGLVGVPVVFVSGDAGICAEANEVVPGIASVAVKEGLGGSTTSLHPQVAIEQIRSSVQQVLQTNLTRFKVRLPEHFSVEITYRDDIKAYGASFYPGANLKDAFTIQFEHKNFYEVLRLMAFVL